METSHVPERFREIDSFRGLAIVMMVTYHVAFDLSYFGIAPLPVTTGAWRVLAIATASLFLAIAGVSLAISGAHARARLGRADFIRKYLLRGGFIFLLGMGITLVTWVLLPGDAIVFGILHLIGVSVMLAPLFLGFRRANLVLGALVILAGFFMTSLAGPAWLLWLGLRPPGFTSLDYTPLLPWFGVVLLGMYAGQSLYPGGRRGFSLPWKQGSRKGLLAFLGRHSLLIYLVHQPLILLAIAIAWSPAVIQAA